MYNALIPLLGVEHTETLMAHLLPRSEMNERFDRIDERFDRLNERFYERFDRLFIAQTGGYTALAIAIFLS